MLINKALIEIPPKWAGRPPVFPGAVDELLGDWPGTTGLAEDVRRYGRWIRDEAEKRIGHLYPKATLPDGSKAMVIAWIWARTVKFPNPGCGLTAPLVNSFTLSNRSGSPTHIRPIISDMGVSFEISTFALHAAARAQACWTSRISSVVAGRGVGGRNRAAMIWRRSLRSMSQVAGSVLVRYQGAALRREAVSVFSWPWRAYQRSRML
ncbi:MAG: hypothetical protein ACRDSL_07750 [Pseudonocardiaceae bacterium]